MFRFAQIAGKNDSFTECARSVGFTEGAQSSLKDRNKKIPRLGIDLLGGDLSSPSHMIEILSYLYEKIEESFDLVVFSDPRSSPSLEKFRCSNRLTPKKLQIIDAEDVIKMDDDPLQVVRQKQNSSMCLGVRLLKEKRIDSFISTGNTGALITSAKIYLPMLMGISRTALIALLPTKKEPIAVLDVGASIHCIPDHLFQFAKLGIAFQKTRGIPRPTVGLLNIGEEEKKGGEVLVKTHQLLRQIPCFVGNVEGKDAFSGDIHVLVTDGFTGNVFLKTSEGISSFILDTIHQNQHIDPSSKSLLKHLEPQLYSTEYAGAILCGMDGIIIKCHGNAHPAELKRSVRGAIRLIQGSFLNKIKSQLAQRRR